MSNRVQITLNIAVLVYMAIAMFMTSRIVLCVLVAWAAIASILLVRIVLDNKKTD